MVEPVENINLTEPVDAEKTIVVPRCWDGQKSHFSFSVKTRFSVKVASECIYSFKLVRALLAAGNGKH